MKDAIKSTIVGGIQLGAMGFVAILTYQILSGSLEGVQKALDNQKAAKNGAKK